MARTLWFWTFLVLWSVPCGIAVVLVDLATLGLLRWHLVGWFSALWGRPVLWAGGIRCTVRGREHLAGRRGRVAVINHSSLLDVPVGALVAPVGSVAIAKMELWRIPVLGQLLWLVGFVFIERGDHAQAIETISRVAEQVRERQWTAWFAPEGTRLLELGRFKRGAFRVAREAGVPVVPLVLHGAGDLMPPRAWRVRPGEIVLEIKPPREIPADQGLRAVADDLHDDYARWLAEGPGNR